MINDDPYLLQETYVVDIVGIASAYGVLNTIFLNISNYLPHLELRNRSIQIIVINECCRYIECRYKEV